MNNLKKTFSGIFTQILIAFVIVLSNGFKIQSAGAAPVLKIKFIETPLMAFEGIYQNKVNTFFYFKITVAGTTLLAKQIDGDRQIVLTRKSEFVFEMKDDDGDENVPVIFSKNAAGEIATILVADKDEWVKVKEYVPTKEITLTADQLKKFEGKYKLAGKDALLQITATATGLKLKQLWDNREIDFVAISDVDFLNKQIPFPLKFTRDAVGNVTQVLAFNHDLWDRVKE